MNVIINPNPIVIKILGEQKIKEDRKYRLLSFCRIIEFEGTYLLYNNMTKCLLEIEQETYDLLTKAPLEHTGEIDFLVRNWFLVSINNDDMLLQNQLTTMLEAIKEKNDYIDSYVILTTTDCNARCFYCYEKDIFKCSMDEKTALDVVDYIYKNSKGNKIKIVWFGGEPLYNIKAINIITKKLSKLGVEFTSHMVSNGYLFNKETINTAKQQWHLKNVQITLDGTEEIYNKCKNYIYTNTQSPYKIVLNNIADLIDNQINVKIRLNMDNHNQENLYKLIDELADKYGKSEYLTVYVSLLFENEGNMGFRSDAEHFRMSLAVRELHSYIKKKGFYSETSLTNAIKNSYCIADKDSSVVIAPDGRLGKCEHYEEKDAFGSIYSNNINKIIINKWKQRAISIDLCNNCVFYPDCYLRLFECPSIKNRPCDKYTQNAKLNKLDAKIIKTFKEFKKNDL